MKLWLVFAIVSSVRASFFAIPSSIAEILSPTEQDKAQSQPSSSIAIVKSSSNTTLCLPKLHRFFELSKDFFADASRQIELQEQQHWKTLNKIKDNIEEIRNELYDIDKQLDVMERYKRGWKKQLALPERVDKKVPDADFEKHLMDVENKVKEVHHVAHPTGIRKYQIESRNRAIKWQRSFQRSQFQNKYIEMQEKLKGLLYERIVVSFKIDRKTKDIFKKRIWRGDKLKKETYEGKLALICEELSAQLNVQLVPIPRANTTASVHANVRCGTCNNEEGIQLGKCSVKFEEFIFDVIRVFIGYESTNKRYYLLAIEGNEQSHILDYVEEIYGNGNEKRNYNY